VKHIKLWSRDNRSAYATWKPA